MKVRDLREEYESGEVEILGVETPRSGKSVHSLTYQKDHIGQNHITPESLEDVVWEGELEDKIDGLTGSNGSVSLLVKNLKVVFEE